MDHIQNPYGRPVLHLFAGAGGGILADIIEGNIVVCAVEWKAYPVASLCARQNDGVLPPFPIWSDVRTFRSDNPECRGMFDALRSIAGNLIVAAGFPCTDISPAGRGEGLDGEASGLYREALRIVGEIRPGELRLENSSALIVRGLDRIAGELAQMGYVGRNGVVSAADAGAPHERARTWIVANARHIGGWDVRPPEGRTGQEGERPADSGPVSGPDEQSETVAHASSERLGEARRVRRDEPEERPSGSSETDLADSHSFGRHEGSDSIRQGQSRIGESGDLPDTESPGLEIGRRSGETLTGPAVYGRWWDFDPADLPDTDSSGRYGGTGQLGAERWAEPSSEGSVSDTDGDTIRLQSEPEFGSVSSAISGYDGKEEFSANSTRESVLRTQFLGGDAREQSVAESSMGMEGTGRSTEPELGGMADGMASGLGQPTTYAGGKLDRVGKGIPARVPRLKALGNGQVPLAAVKAWRALK